MNYLCNISRQLHGLHSKNLLHARNPNITILFGYGFSGLKKIRNYTVREIPQVQLPLLESGRQNQYIEQDIILEQTGIKQLIKDTKEYRSRRDATIMHLNTKKESITFLMPTTMQIQPYFQPIGRMIQKIASAIRGRNSPLYRNNHSDLKNGDICVIINASDPLLTGKKLLFKQLIYHTGFVGHLRRKSYRAILNEKPQLLYHYLLRKAVPKNYISMSYLENLKIYRGPTHDIPHLPQFAPDRNTYHNLPQFDLNKMLKNPKDLKVVAESQLGVTTKIFGQQLQKQNIPDLTNQQVKKTKMVPKISKKQYEKLQRKAKRLEERYKRINAPYKKKEKQDIGFTLFTDERQAKKTPYYDEMVDEDAPEEDDQPPFDPFLPENSPKDQ